MSRAKWGLSIPSIVISLLISLLAGTPARAAEPSPLQPGARVRATLIVPSFGSVIDPKRIEGRLTALTNTAIVLEASSGKPRVLPLDNLADLERSVRPSRNGRGALIGLGVGATVSAVAILRAYHYDPGDQYAEYWGDLGKVLTVAFSVVFTGLTTLAGAIIAPGEKWEPVPSDQFRPADRVPPPPQVQVGFAPAPDGGGRIGVSVSF